MVNLMIGMPAAQWHLYGVVMFCINRIIHFDEDWFLSAQPQSGMVLNFHN